MLVVDRHSIGRLIGLFVVGDHHRNRQALERLSGKSDADVAAVCRSGRLGWCDRRRRFRERGPTVDKEGQGRREACWSALGTDRRRKGRRGFDARRVLDEPGHLFARAFARCDQQVALVLSALVVHDDDELSSGEGGEGGLHGGEGRGGH